MSNSEVLKQLIDIEGREIAVKEEVALVEAHKPIEPLMPEFKEPEKISFQEPHVSIIDWIALYFTTGLVVGLIGVLLGAITAFTQIPAVVLYVPLWALWIASFFIRPFREKFKEKVLAWKNSRPNVAGERLAIESQNKNRLEQAQKTYDSEVEKYNLEVVEYPEKLKLWEQQLASSKEEESRVISKGKLVRDSLLADYPELRTIELDVSTLQSLMQTQGINDLSSAELAAEYQRIDRIRTISNKKKEEQRLSYAENQKVQRLQQEAEARREARTEQNMKKAAKVAGFTALGVVGGAKRKEKERKRAIDKAYRDAERQAWIDDSYAKDRPEEAARRKNQRDLQLQKDLERARRK